MLIERTAHILPALLRLPESIRVMAGIVLAFAGWGLRELFALVAQGPVQFLPFFPAVVLAAFFFGFWPGVACTLVSAAIVWVAVESFGIGQLPFAGDVARIGLFIVTGLFICGLSELARKSFRHQEALRQSDERYGALFRSIDEGFCIFEMIFDRAGNPVDYRWLEANEAFERHTGIKDPVGRTARELVPNLDESWFRIYGEVAITGEARRFENHAPAMGRWFDVYAFRFGRAEDRQVALVFNDITDRKNAELQQRRGMETFKALVQKSPFGIFVIDADFRLVHISAGAQKVFRGIEPLFGRDFAEILRLLWDESFAAEAIERYRHTLDTGEPYHSKDTTEKRRDLGVTEAYDWRIERVTMPDGRFGVVCHFYDLSERNRYEAALRASERRLEEIFDTAPAFMAVVRGPDFIFEKANRAYQQMMGGREVMGKPLLEALPEIADQPYLKLLQHVIQTGEAVERRSAKVLLSAPGGPPEEKTLDFVYLPLREADGRVSGVLAHGVDLTERVKAEEALRASENQFRQLAELSPQLVWTARSDGVVDYYSSRASEYAGIEEKADGTWRWEPVVHEDDAEATRTAWAESVAMGHSFEQEHRIRMADGSMRWHLSRAEPVIENGRVTRWFGTATDIHDIKRAQEVLRESEAGFRRMADASPAMLWVTDREHQCTYLSRRWQEFTGQTLEEGLGMGWTKAAHPDDQALAGATFLAAARQRQEVRCEFRLRTRDGGYRCVLDTGRPVYDAEGNFDGYIGNVIDIHERVVAEGEVREREARFRDLADNIAQFAWMADPGGSIFWYNKRWFDYTGTTPEEMMGWGWKKVHHRDHVDRVVARYRERIEAGEVWEDIFPLRGKDGSYRWFLSRAVPIRDSEGRVSRWFGTNTDVTEQREAQEALKRSEERYRAVVEGQVEMVSRFRRDGTLLFVNGAYARTLGGGDKAPEDLVGSNLWDWVQPEDRADVEAMLDCLRPEAPETHIENRVETVRGVRWTLWHNRALAFDADGRGTEFQSAGIDITDRKNAEEALRRANADLLQFASAASHDLKEPLRGISRLASFISTDERGLGEESRQRLDRVRVLCERLTRMVSGLIEHARTGLEPQRAPCDLNDIITRVVDTSAEELAARMCEVTLRGRLPVVDADAVLMERIFANLIANAVKFNESPVKRVEIYTKAGEVAVRDNGIGIDPKHQPTIFQLFRRLHSPERYAGEGLGLALTRKIVEAHGGSIRVESAPGVGSTFYIRLAVISPGVEGKDRQILVSPEGPRKSKNAGALSESRS